MFSLSSQQTLRVFDACSRLGSFTLAADELGMTQGAISHHIKNLESKLGFDVFDRCPRGVEINDAGRNVLHSIKINFNNINQAIERERRNTERLLISVHVGFASLWLLPKIDDFREKNKNLELSISVTSEPTNFVDNRASIGIEYSHRSKVSNDLYVPEYLIPVCSPSFAKENDIYLDCSPEKLLESKLISDSATANRDETDLWSYWANHLNVTISTDRQFSNCFSNISIQMAELGFGIALGRNILVSDAIRDGRLIPLSSKRIISPFVYNLVENPNQEKHAEIHSFKNWFFDSI